MKREVRRCGLPSYANSVMELRIGEGKAFEFCLVDGFSELILHWCKPRLLGDKIHVKVAEVPLRSLQGGEKRERTFKNPTLTV